VKNDITHIMQAIFPMMRAILIEEESQIYDTQFRWFH
jgi:hypothetical protein